MPELVGACLVDDPAASEKVWLRASGHRDAHERGRVEPVPVNAVWPSSAVRATLTGLRKPKRIGKAGSRGLPLTPRSRRSGVQVQRKETVR
jgi:hypothetical protein